MASPGPSSSADPGSSNGSGSGSGSKVEEVLAKVRGELSSGDDDPLQLQVDEDVVRFFLDETGGDVARTTELLRQQLRPHAQPQPQSDGGGAGGGRHLTQVTRRRPKAGPPSGADGSGDARGDDGGDGPQRAPRRRSRSPGRSVQARGAVAVVLLFCVRAVGTAARLAGRGIHSASTLVLRTTTFVLRLIVPPQLASWLNRLVLSRLSGLASSRHATIADPVQAASHFVHYFNTEFCAHLSGASPQAGGEVEMTPLGGHRGNGSGGNGGHGGGPSCESAALSPMSPGGPGGPGGDGVGPAEDAVAPDFEVCGHYEALGRARTASRFLVCYLHAPEHRDARRFCRETLSRPEVAHFLGEHFTLWGGSVANSRDAYRLAQALRVTRYPCVAVLTSSSIIRNFGGGAGSSGAAMAGLNGGAGRRGGHGHGAMGGGQLGDGGSGMALIAAFEGFLSQGSLVELLERVLESHGPMLVAARAEQEERAFNRRIREEQEQAFAEALAEDQRREREREAEREQEREREREEAAARERLEAEAREREERELAVRSRRRERSESIPEEPPLEGEGSEGVVKILVRLPDGSRIQRRFLKGDKVSAVYNFVDSLESNDCYNYKLVSNFPRRVFDEGTLSQTLEEAGLSPQGSLFLQSED